MEELRKRLVSAGLEGFEFVLQDEEPQKPNSNNSSSTECGKDVTHVKTLLWEAKMRCKNGVESESLHFATALRYHDRVDEDMLKQRLLEQLEKGENSMLPLPIETAETAAIQQPKEVISLKLAKISKAEALAGYMSGTIPPVGHATPLFLFVDQALVVVVVEQQQGKPIMLSTGSGSFRHSLWIRLENLLQYAKVLGNGVCVAPISSASVRLQQEPKATRTPPTSPKTTTDETLVVPDISTIHLHRQGQEKAIDNDEEGDSPESNYSDIISSNMSDEMKSLGKLLRDSAVRSGKARVLRTVISQAGDRFPELFQMRTELNFSRNAMHLAAWKQSDLETIELLVGAGKKYGLDLVNTISTGHGNYGKTPIFYAINQRNDVVVRFLVENGANLLIVNRNGNTPVGLASKYIGQLLQCTHELLAKTRIEQLQAGGSFQNYSLNPEEVGLHSCLRSKQVEEASCDSIEAAPRQEIPDIIEEADGGTSLKELSKMLRDAAGKKRKAGTVRSIIKQAGDGFPEIVAVGTEGNFTKNALHLAAWKGDPESIELLIDAGTEHGLDLVNAISTGNGNYGKTPIFYSITQDRDDVVKLLVGRGANLLIINNKGQSPCSMAVTHLQPETCQLMFAKEYEQIQSGVEFQNFRLSYGDNKQYGDLDPRVLVDQINYGVDIVADQREYAESLKTAMGQLDTLDEPSYKHLPVSFQPRSLRPTTHSGRQSRADKFRLVKSVCARKIHASKLPHSRVFLDGVDEEEKQADHPPEVEFYKEDTKSTTAETTKLSAEVVANLPELCLSHFLVDDNKANGEPLQAVVVDQESQIQMLLEEVARTVEESKKIQESSDISAGDYDNKLLNLSWGLDCEWKPSRDRGREYPVAVLQLSSFRQTFLVDLQELCQAGVKDPSSPMSNTERQLCETLIQLFTNSSILILGFGIGGDITKLGVSFPHIPCFQVLHAVVDLDVLIHNSFPQSFHDELRSLQRAVAYLLQTRLSKIEQCSNWQHRPLTSSQIEYAALDAAVLPHLLKEALASYASRNQATSHGFFSKYPHLMVSWRLSFLDQEHVETSLSHRCAYDIQYGSIRNLLSLWYAKQTWQTGKSEPPQPTSIPLDMQEDQLENREDKDSKKLETKQKAKVKRQERRTKKPLMLSTISIDVLPPAGQFLGFTKETCISELLSKSVLDSLDESFYLGFNRRGGIIQMKDGWLLFVNFGAGKEKRKYVNRFSGKGRYMTFSIDPRKDLDGIFYDYVSVGYHGQEAPNSPVLDAKILLFARPDSGSQYIFCGDCNCVSEEVSNGGIDLLLEMKRLDALETTAYMIMVG